MNAASALFVGVEEIELGSHQGILNTVEDLVWVNTPGVEFLVSVRSSLAAEFSLAAATLLVAVTLLCPCILHLCCHTEGCVSDDALVGCDLERRYPQRMI